MLIPSTAELLAFLSAETAMAALIYLADVRD